MTSVSLWGRAGEGCVGQGRAGQGPPPGEGSVGQCGAGQGSLMYLGWPPLCKMETAVFSQYILCQGNEMQ